MSKPFSKIVATIILIVLQPLYFVPNGVAQWQFDGNVGAELQAYTEYDKANYSVLAQPELSWSNEDESNIFRLSVHARHDDLDEERSYVDIRELLWIVSRDSWEFSGGIGKVFWGVTESNHLVDIVNQTDLSQSIDGESKLGQPLLKLSNSQSWGIIDLYLLPYFRERRFAGIDSPLSGGLAINPLPSTYQSSAKQQHIDFALNYSHYIGNWDIGLSYFNGTNREPEIRQNSTTPTVLEQHYNQISQVGITLQATIEQWLFKVEAIHRETNDMGSNIEGTDHTTAYLAATAGLEYTFFGINQSVMDLGLLLEYSFDERDELATNPLQNDIFFGARLSPNDMQDTQFLVGIVQDQDQSENILAFVEASRRMGESFKIIVDARLFDSNTTNDPIFRIRDADYASVTLEYYF